MARKNVNCSLCCELNNNSIFFFLNGLWAILLNSVSTEETILTPPVLDELSKDEMTGPSSRVVGG